MHNRRFRQTVIVFTSFICLFYLFYRGLFTLNFSGPYAVFASLFLYISEVYGVIVQLLFFLQVWDVSHPPQQPVLEGHTVDVFVPTYNEDVDLLRTTLKACVAMDYPHRTFLCDDGGTEARCKDPVKGPPSRDRAAALKALCAEVGAIYITRPDNSHAKAGNCNHAFEKTDGEFIIIFDADHVPERNFIIRLIGYFKDEKLAFIQTPHSFYNFHSFQSCYNHNKRHYWEDGQLFYEVIQPGRNRWNAPIFAGSAAMFRRTALEEVGYIATETITEDMHTGLRMHSRGWKSLGIPERMVAGQAAPDVTTFHTQRLRWGEGNLSIMAHNNPLTTPGLSWGQRLCYLGSMIHWAGGLFKIAIYLTPLMMLLTGVPPVAKFTWFLLGLTVLYMVACIGSFKVISNGHGSFWNNELFSMAGFWTQMQGTMKALFLRKFQQFVVTSKRGRQSNSVWPFIKAHVYFIAASLMALLWGWSDFLFGLTDDFTKPILASGWTIFHMLLAIVVVRRSLWPDDRRYSYRHIVHLPVTYQTLGSEGAPKTPARPLPQTAMTIDLSEGGMALLLYENLPIDSKLETVIRFGGETLRVRATVVNVREMGNRSGAFRHGIKFEELSTQQRDLVAKLSLQYAVPRLYREYEEGRISFVARVSSGVRRLLSRRTAPRLRCHLPLALEDRSETSPVHTVRPRVLAVTDDLSRDHLSVLLDAPMPQGTPVHFELVGPSGELRGQGRVIRTETELYAANPYQRTTIHLEHFEAQDRVRYNALFRPEAKRWQQALRPPKGPLPVPLAKPAVRGALGMAPAIVLTLLTFHLLKRDEFFLRDVVRAPQPPGAVEMARLEQVYADTIAQSCPTMERLVLLTGALVRANKSAEADRVLLVLAPMDRSNLDLQLARAQTLTRTRDYEQADIEFQQLLTQSQRGNLSPEQKRNLLIAAARSSIHAGNAEGAVARIREVLAAYPETALRNEFAGALLGVGKNSEAVAVYDTPPSDLTGRRLLTLAYASAGNYATAETLCRAILRDKPDDPDAELMLADILKGGQQLKQSTEIITKLQKLNPGSPEVRKRLAFLALGGGNFGEALTLFQGLLDEGNDKPEVQAGYVDAAAAAPQLDETHRKTALQILEVFKEDNNAPRLARLAWVLSRLGEGKQSLGLLERAYQADSSDLTITKQYVGALVAANRWDDALPLLDRLPRNLDTRRLTVGAHIYKKDLAAAEKECRAILEQLPNDQPARRQLADILCTRGQFKESLLLLEALAVELPGDSGVSLRVAEVTLAAGNAADASTRFMGLLEQSFDEPRIWQGFLDSSAGVATLTTLHARMAERLATQALGGLVKDPVYLSRLVWLLHRLEQNTAPERRVHPPTIGKLLDAAVAQKPKAPAVRKELSGMLAVGGRYQEARKMYDGLALDPQDRARLADLHVALGDYPAAEKLYWEMLQTTPRDSKLLLRLADVLSWKGDYTRSLGLLAQLQSQQGDEEAILPRIAEVTLWSGDTSKSVRLFEELLMKRFERPPLWRGFLAAVGALSSLTPTQGALVKRIHERALGDDSTDPRLASDVVFLCRLSRALSQAGAADAAKTVLDRALALRTEKLDELQVIADLLAALNRPQEALEHANRIPVQRRSPLRMAQLLAAVQRFSESEAQCREHLKTAPTDRGARKLLADVLSGQGKSKEAVAILESLIDPERPDHLLSLRLAEATLASGAFSRALARFQALPRAIQDRTNVRQGFIAAAAGLLSSPSPVALTAVDIERLDAIAALVLREPSDDTRIDSSPPFVARLAWVLLQSGAKTNVDKLLNRAVALNPSGAGERKEIAGVLCAAGRYADAAKLSEGLPVDNDVTSLSRAAWLRLQSGKKEEALHLLDRAMALRTEDPRACKELAGVLGAAGRFADALSLFERLPDAQRDGLLLAELYAGERRWEESEKLCRGFLEKQPDNVRGRRLLAGLLLATKRAEAARQVLLKLTKVLPHDAAVAEQLAQATLGSEGPDQALPLFLALPEALQDSLATQRGFIDAAASAKTLSHAEARMAQRVYTRVLAETTGSTLTKEPLFLARLALVLHRTDGTANAGKVKKLLDLALASPGGTAQQKELVGILSATKQIPMALKLYEGLPEAERDRLMLVRLHMGGQEWDRAEKCCRSILADEPNNQKARRVLVDVLCGKKEHKAALVLLLQLARELPEDAELRVRVAEVTLWSGAPDRAILLYLELPPAVLKRDDVRQGFVSAAAAMRNLTQAQTALARSIHEQTMTAKLRHEGLWSDVPFLTRLGLVLFRAGDHEKANVLLGRALSLQAADQATRSELAGALAMAERYHEAVKLYDGLPEQQDVLFLSRNAWARHQIGQRDRASKLLDVAVSLKAPDDDGGRELAGVLGAVGKYRQALGYYDSLPLVDDPAYLSRYAWALLQDRRKPRALELLDKALALKPAEPLVCRELAGVLAVAGRHDDALRLYRTLPVTLERQIAEAEVLVAAGRQQEAEELSRGLAEKHPRDKRVRRLLACVLVRNEKTAREGLAKLEALVKEDPDDLAGHLVLADSLLGMKAFEQAARIYETALLGAFQQPRLWSRFVDALAGARGVTQGQKRLLLRMDKAVEEEPDLRTDATFLSRLAWVLHKGEEKVQSIAVARRAAKLAPRDPATRRELAGVLAALGEHAAALGLLDGMKLDLQGRLVRIDALVAAKNHEAAESECRELLETDPGSEPLKRRLVQVLNGARKHPAALVLLRELARTHPDDADLAVDLAACTLWSGQADTALVLVGNILDRSRMARVHRFNESRPPLDLWRLYIDSAGSARPSEDGKKVHRKRLSQMAVKLGTLDCNQLENTVLLGRLAWALRNFGGGADAVGILEKLVKADPKNRVQRRQLAEALTEAGEYKKAEDHYKVLLRMATQSQRSSR